jgi:arsenate reductase
MVPAGDGRPTTVSTAYPLVMPAPLGKTPTKKMPDIQVFGPDDSQATRAALRFFRERRIVVHHVDLRKRTIAAGELRRFVQRLGARALLDVESRAYAELGLAHMRLDDTEIVARLLADPRLIRLPLVRHGNEMTAGRAETTWAAWLKPAGAAAR